MIRRFILLAVVLTLGACGGFFSVRDAGDHHIVRSGETLYSIAWSSGKDYRDLAAWNGVPPPYLIKPGQRLRLGPVYGDERTGGASDAVKVHRVKRGETIYSISHRYGIPPRQLAKVNNISSPYLIKPGQKLRVGKTGPKAASNKKATRKNSFTKRTRVSTARSGITWTWPVTGSVLRRFGQDNNKGIDIAGRKDKKIKAAAKGRVVYRGSGLRGYGNLVIVKHSNDFLSAYAHCRKIYVKEGDVIQKGSRIASMGKSGTDTVKLHFEIRYKGTPVDPLKYLPNR